MNRCFQYHSNGYFTNSFFFTVYFPELGEFWGTFWFLFGYFHDFFGNCFLMKFAYIFLKIFWWCSDKKTRWEMLPFDGRLIWDHFVYFSLYHGNGSLFFFVKLWIGFVAINLTITKNTIHTAFTLPDHFWAFWAQFLVHIPPRLEKPKLFSWCVAQNILVLLWWSVIKKILICFSLWLGNFLVIFYHFGVCSSSSRDPFNI